MGCLVSADADRESTTSTNEKRRETTTRHRSTGSGTKTSRNDAQWWRKQSSEKRKLSTSATASGGTLPTSSEQHLPSKNRLSIQPSPLTGASEHRIAGGGTPSLPHEVPDVPMEPEDKKSVAAKSKRATHSPRANGDCVRDQPQTQKPSAGDAVDSVRRPSQVRSPSRRTSVPSNGGRRQSRNSSSGEQLPPDASSSTTIEVPSSNPPIGIPVSRPQQRNAGDTSDSLVERVGDRLTLAAANPLDVAGPLRDTSTRPMSAECSTVAAADDDYRPPSDGCRGDDGEEGDSRGEIPVALLRDAFGPELLRAAAQGPSSLQHSTRSAQSRDSDSSSYEMAVDEPSSGSVGSLSLAELVAQRLGASRGSSSIPTPAASSASRSRRASSACVGPQVEGRSAITLMTDLTYSKPRIRIDQPHRQPPPPSSVLASETASPTNRRSGANDVTTFATVSAHGCDPLTTMLMRGTPALLSEGIPPQTVAAPQTPAQEIAVQSLQLDRSQHSSVRSSLSDPRVVNSALSNLSLSGIVPSDCWALMSRLRERDVLKRMQIPSSSLARLDAVIVRCLRKWCVLWRVAAAGNAEVGVEKPDTSAATGPCMDDGRESASIAEPSMCRAEVQSSEAVSAPAALQEAELVGMLRDLWIFVSIRQDPRASRMYPELLQHPLVHVLMKAVEANPRARTLLDAYQESRRELLRRRGSMESDAYRHVPDEVLPGMFVGSYHAAMSPGLLSQLGIRAVVSCVGNLFPEQEQQECEDEVSLSATAARKTQQRGRAQLLRDEKHWEAKSGGAPLHRFSRRHTSEDEADESLDEPTFSVRDGVHYVFLEMRDKTSYRVDVHFETAIRFLRSRYFEHRENILVLCGAGVSRAPTVMGAFLCDVFMLPVDLSLEILRQSRSSIRPNEAFLVHLIRWYSPELLETNGE